ncbi:MAG TPA: hypothetical protein VL308_24015 [Gemmatimonadaceae bacterium]|jgi:hypothetical protein|nr:hypothetical protein [Gemmatimonadaceae bacterium]
MRTLKGRLAIFTLTGTALVIAGCSGQSVTGSAHVLTRGTWGGENAGAILDDTLAHVHIGCTLGNFPLPTVVDDQGRFTADGNYTLRAYPIRVGPELPAVFTGVVSGNLLTLSVAVDDTVEKKLVPLGPVTVVLGREPRMQACPICRSIAKPLMAHPLMALLRPAT